MIKQFRKGWLAQAMVLLFVLSLSSSAVATGTGNARVIPTGKVDIYDGDQKIGELRSEAPLPVGKILTSSEKFGVKLDGLYLVATENSRFAVSHPSGGTDVFVEEGRVYFLLNEVKDTLTLSTPQDTVTVQSALIHASTDASSLRGYLLYENGQMEIGVIDGGKLVLADASGQRMIDSGNRIQFQHVQAALGGGAGAGGGVGAGTIGIIIGGVLLAGLGIYAILDDDDGEGVTSPFTP